MRKVRTSKKIKTFGQWAVTIYGLECTEIHYPIEKKRLSDADWKVHVCAKRWVNAGDFCAALDFAREHHNQPVVGNELSPYAYR